MYKRQATNIPPHNLQEVVDGCLYCLRNPACTVDELMEIIPAPDFPTGGIIYGMSGVREGYRTGRGRVIMRAKTHFEAVSYTHLDVYKRQGLYWISDFPGVRR